MHVADKKMRSSQPQNNGGSGDVITQLQQELEQKDAAWKRALADYHNLEQRTKSERQQQAQWAASELVEDLLPTLDHLQLALQHFSDPSLKMIADELARTLQHHGLVAVQAVGQVFDPNTMEAVGTEPGEPEIVIREQQAGYNLHGKLLRPARVIVGKDN